MVNVSVSGKTLKECHDQILALAEEISGQATTRTATQSKEISKGNVDAAATNDPARVLSMVQPPAPQFPVNMAVETAAPSNGGNVDADGMPWDARIHSGSREKTSKGKWKSRRGVDDAVVATVEAELKAQGFGKKVAPFGSMTTEQYQAQVQAAPTIPVAPTTNVVNSLPPEGSVLNQMAAPMTFTPPAPKVVGTTHDLKSFKENLVVIMNNLASEGKITNEHIASWKQGFGGKEIQDWHKDEQSVANFFEGMISWGLIQRA